MTKLLKNIQKQGLCRNVSWLLMALIIGFIIYQLAYWQEGPVFIPNGGLTKHETYHVSQTGGGNNGVGPTYMLAPTGVAPTGLETRIVDPTAAEKAVSGSQLKSITQDPGLFLNPDGGNNICHVIGSSSRGTDLSEGQTRRGSSSLGQTPTGSSPADFQCQFANPTLCSMSAGDQKSLAIAMKTGACFRANRQSGGSGPYGKTIDASRIAKPGCLPCRARDQLNYVSQVGSGIGQNNILYPTDPRHPNASELYSQFYRDVQNQLAEHTVDNHRFPNWSTLTSSYRNDPQYCGIGQTVDEFVPNDHCFNPTEYHSIQQLDNTKSFGVPQAVPSVINTQIDNMNRRLRSQVVYTPVRTVDEIIPANGMLNEKPSNFTSEKTRTFDFFTFGNLGHVNYLY